MYRISRPGAQIYVGEIPFVPGPPPEPRFNTVRETLVYLYQKHGVRTCLGMARRMAYWRVTGKPLVISRGARHLFLTLSLKSSSQWPLQLGFASCVSGATNIGQAETTIYSSRLRQNTSRTEYSSRIPSMVGQASYNPALGSPNTSAVNASMLAPDFHASSGRPAFLQVCSRKVMRSQPCSTGTWGSSRPR